MQEHVAGSHMPTYKWVHPHTHTPYTPKERKTCCFDSVPQCQGARAPVKRWECVWRGSALGPLSPGACCGSGLQLLVPAALPACHPASCPGSPASTHPPAGHHGSVEATQELRAGNIRHFRWADAAGSRASTGTSPTEHRWQS